MLAVFGAALELVGGVDGLVDSCNLVILGLAPETLEEEGLKLKEDGLDGVGTRPPRGLFLLGRL